MKTPAAALARPSTASGVRRRRLAVVGLVAPVIALAACSGESPISAMPTTAGDATTASVSTTATSSSAPTKKPGDTPSASSTLDKLVSTPMLARMKDPDLGHTITASRVARHLPWPSGQPVGAKQFEIVGVWVTLTAGSRYSASIDPAMLSLIASSPSQTVLPTNEFGGRFGATVLKPVKRTKRAAGWVFFKVDRGTSSTLRLAFNRPAYQVSTTGKKLPAKTFTVALTK